MANPWKMRTEQFTAFSEEDRRRPDEFASQRRRHHGAREDIVREGEHSPITT